MITMQFQPDRLLIERLIEKAEAIGAECGDDPIASSQVRDIVHGARALLLTFPKAETIVFTGA